jgi:hypothetical protein
MCQYLPSLTRTVPLSRSEWGACVAVGATPLLISAILKLLPVSVTEKLNASKFVDEDHAATSKILDKYENVAAAAAGKAKNEEEHELIGGRPD